MEGKRARVGITHYAQDQLGDVVFVELPKVGAKVTQLQTFGVVESVKAVSDLFAPLSGVVAEVNQELTQQPELSSPAEADKLMTAQQYEEFLKTAGGH